MHDIAEIINSNRKTSFAVAVATAFIRKAEIIVVLADVPPLVVALNECDMIYEKINGVTWEERLLNTHDMYAYFQWFNNITPLIDFR